MSFDDECEMLKSLLRKSQVNWGDEYVGSGSAFYRRDLAASSVAQSVTPPPPPGFTLEATRSNVVDTGSPSLLPHPPPSSLSPWAANEFTMVQKSHESRCKYWATCLLVCWHRSLNRWLRTAHFDCVLCCVFSFARTAHSRARE